MIDWGDAPTWVGGVGTAGALVFAGVQLWLDRRQRRTEELQRRGDETQRRVDEKRSQLSSVEQAVSDLLGIAGHISMLANTYGIRRTAFERAWTRRPGRSVVATLYGPRLITELIATTERLLATYHRLKFTSTHEPFVQAVEHLIETVQATVTNATGTDTWDLRRPPHLHRHHPYHCRRHRARAELRSDSADRVTLRTSRTLLSGVTRNAATLTTTQSATLRPGTASGVLGGRRCSGTRSARSGTATGS